MPKNVCILTTNEDDFFTPPVLDYLSINLINELSCIVFVSGFASIKRKLFTIFQLKFTEIIEILMQRFEILNQHRNSVIKIFKFIIKKPDMIIFLFVFLFICYWLLLFSSCFPYVY